MSDLTPGDLVLDIATDGNDLLALKLIFVSAEETSYVYVYSDEVTARRRTLKSGLEVLGTELLGVTDE